jgi:hypothetical protein
MIFTNCAKFGGASRGSNLNKKLSINFTVLLPLRWHIIFIINSFNWANWLTRTAINTLIGLDIEHAITLIDTVNWALFDARFVFNINTRLSNYVGHASPYSCI